MGAQYGLCPECERQVPVPAVRLAAGDREHVGTAECPSCGWLGLESQLDFRKRLAIWGAPPSDDVGQSVKITSDQTFTSATLASITGLNFGAVTGIRYHFRFVLVVRSSVATEGVKVSLTTPAFSTFAATVRTNFAADGAAAAWSGSITSSGDAVTTPEINEINTDYTLTIEGLIHPSASGPVQAQAATESGTSTLTVRESSCVFVTVI